MTFNTPVQLIRDFIWTNGRYDTDALRQFVQVLIQMLFSVQDILLPNDAFGEISFNDDGSSICSFYG